MAAPNDLGHIRRVVARSRDYVYRALTHLVGPEPDSINGTLGFRPLRGFDPRYVVRRDVLMYTPDCLSNGSVGPDESVPECRTWSC